MRIAVSTESACDLPKDLIKQKQISVIPFEIALGTDTFFDGERNTNEIFEFVKQNKILPKTTAINEFVYAEYFKKLLSEFDAVVHICLSGEITSTVNNAKRAAESLDNVFIVDGKTLSSGLGLLALYARALADTGISAEEVANAVREKIEKLQVSFVVETLDYLYKGGRCSGIQLLGANLLKIRPRIIMQKGKMFNDKKHRGSMSLVVKKYCEEILKDYAPDKDTVFITYSSATEQMLESAKSVCETAGFKNIFFANAGCTVTSHCGENTLGLMYFTR